MSWHRRIFVLVAVAATFPVACATAEAPRSAEQRQPILELIDSKEAFGCREVRGELVVLFRPGVGALVLAGAEFTGSQLVGEIDGTRVRFSFPGLRMPEQVLESKGEYSDPLPLWGMTVSDIDPRDRLGCLGFDRPEIIDPDELRARVRRIAREIPAAP